MDQRNENAWEIEKVIYELCGYTHHNAVRLNPVSAYFESWL
jgi:hypothetical protein